MGKRGSEGEPTGKENLIISDKVITHIIEKPESDEINRIVRHQEKVGYVHEKRPKKILKIPKE